MIPKMSMSYKLEQSKRGLLCKVLLPGKIIPSRTTPGAKQHSCTGQAYDLRGVKSLFPHYYPKHCSQCEAVSLWFWFSSRYNSDAQFHIQPRFTRPKITPLASKTPNPIAHTYDVTKGFLVRLPEAHKHWQCCCFCNPQWQKDCC